MLTTSDSRASTRPGLALLFGVTVVLVATTITPVLAIADPATGRWITRDPHRYNSKTLAVAQLLRNGPPSGTNLNDREYSYLQMNPDRYRDSSGLSATCGDFHGGQSGIFGGSRTASYKVNIGCPPSHPHYAQRFEYSSSIQSCPCNTPGPPKFRDSSHYEIMDTRNHPSGITDTLSLEVPSRSRGSGFVSVTSWCVDDQTRNSHFPNASQTNCPADVNTESAECVTEENGNAPNAPASTRVIHVSWDYCCGGNMITLLAAGIDCSGQETTSHFFIGNAGGCP